MRRQFRRAAYHEEKRDRMKNHYKKRAGIALSLLAGGLACPNAQAQSAIFTNANSNTYGLINTDSIALYINDRAISERRIAPSAERPRRMACWTAPGSLILMRMAV